MKTISKITIGLATAALLFVGCTDATKTESATPAKEAKVIAFQSEESLGLRKTDLYAEEAETAGHQAAYSTTYAGSGHKIARAFQDAPPMIPHDVEGMLPITIKDNQCTGCHMPEVAPSMGATPLPVSHFTNFRAVTSVSKDGDMTKNGKAVENTTSASRSDISITSTGAKLAGARFNCSQCHAPQSGVDLAVENNFEAVFTSEDGASKSSWSGSKLMEGLDTENGL
ncbi:MAG: nitrate reductase cytochrome c-type subunit [Campylobacterota bacterium]|nr:nitrate reductase cytochrome c-type subunit [Campylobacterota bacterium]